MPGESFINVDAVAFTCVDALYSEPPRARIAYAITSALEHSPQPLHEALLELIRTLFDKAGYLIVRKRVSESAEPHPILAESGPELLSLLEEASAFLTGTTHTSPLQQAFGLIEDLKQRRERAAAEGDAAELRLLEQVLVRLRLDAPNTYQHAILTNQIAVNASSRYALGDSGGLLDAFESLCAVAKVIPRSRVRSTMVANVCYLASLLHQHTGDIAPSERAHDLISGIDLGERDWARMANIVACLLLLHEEAPERYDHVLDDVLRLIPREVPEILPEDAIDVAQNLANAYSALTKFTHAARYIELANELGARLLEMPRLSAVQTGQLKANHANRLVERVEVVDLPEREVRESLVRAVELAREACRISADHTVPGEHVATDLECLARCLRALAELQEGSERVSNLDEALMHAQNALRATPVQARAWARHAEVRNHILFDLAMLDRDQWGTSFLDAYQETLQSGYASAITYGLYGHWLIAQGASGAEPFESMLMGARLQNSPVVRTERYMDLLSHLFDVPSEEVEDWRFYVLHESLQGLLADFRKLLWSPRGEEATRGAATTLSWLATVQAEIILLRDGNATQALLALGIVSNGIWAMNVALAPSTTHDEGGADLFLADRLLLRAADEVKVLPYDSDVESPTLVVLVAGPTRGWAIIRRVGQEDRVIELPRCSDTAARSAAKDFSAVLDGAQLRRGTAAPASRGCQDWLQSAVGQPLIESRVDLGEWVAWCPTGALVGLPIHGIRIPHVMAQSYATSPLFDPSTLHGHLSTNEVEPVEFLGWSLYPRGEDELPGVKFEAEVFRRVTKGVTYLDVNVSSLSLTAQEPLHLACHGVSTGPHGDALLALGHRHVPMLEIISLFRGDRPFVLLNACLTAQPAPGLGEQHLTLVKAFQLSGTHSIVGSLWAVADGNGIPDLLIEGFYGELLKEVVPCHCERCVADATHQAIALLQSAGLGWEDWLNWTHTIG